MNTPTPVEAPPRSVDTGRLRRAAAAGGRQTLRNLWSWQGGCAAVLLISATLYLDVIHCAPPPWPLSLGFSRSGCVAIHTAMTLSIAAIGLLIGIITNSSSALRREEQGTERIE